MLSQAQVERFVQDGFVHPPGAFPRPVADECRAILWAKTGCDPDDPATWTRPVIRIGDCAEAPFRQAANTPALHQAFDQLVGVGRWWPPWPRPWTRPASSTSPTGRWPWPPGRPATSGCATRSWSTPPSHTTAAARGSWPATAASHRTAGPRPPRWRLQPGRAGRPPRARPGRPEPLRVPPVLRTHRRRLLATPSEIPHSRGFPR